MRSKMATFCSSSNVYYWGPLLIRVVIYSANSTLPWNEFGREEKIIAVPREWKNPENCAPWC